MRGCALFVVHLFSLLALGAAPAVHAETVAIPGTSVTMSPPPGFAVSSTFSGLENLATRSSITVAEFPQEAYAEISLVFASVEVAAAQFAKQGVRVSDVKQIATGGGSIPFAIGRQDANGIEVVKYFALLRGARTTLLTFNIVDPSLLTQSGAEAVVQSVTLGRAATLEERLAQTGVQVRAAAPFHVADVLMNSGILLTTFEGADPSGMKPAIIILRALGPVDATDPVQISEQLARAIDGFASAQITEQRYMSFAGGNAHFISATAGGRTLLQLTLIPGDRRYLRLVAFGETGAIEAAHGAIMEVASSVSLSD